jgi:hypothetical protein
MLKFLAALAVFLIACLVVAGLYAWRIDHGLAVACYCGGGALTLVLAALVPVDRRMLSVLLAFAVLPMVLGGCSTAGAARINDFATRVDAVGQNVAPALLIVIQQDADAGLVDKAVASQAADYVSAVAVAVQAVKAGSAACAAGADKAGCALAALQASLEAGDQLLANPAINRLIGDTAGPRVAAALKAARTALLAARDVKTAATATDQSQRQAAALAAVFQLNATLLQAIQAAR